MEVVAVIDVAVIICGRHGLVVIVYLVAVMDMLCGRHGLWPSATKLSAYYNGVDMSTVSYVN